MRSNVIAIAIFLSVVACTGHKSSPPRATPTTERGPKPDLVSGVPVHVPRHVCTEVPEPEASQGTKAVKVFFLCSDSTYGDYLVPLTRRVAADAEPLTAALRQLFQGPNEVEREAGLRGNFTPEETGDALVDARIQGRRAVVNLKREVQSKPVMNNVTTTSGGVGFFWPLYATVFQFPQIDDILPQFDGDSKAWGEWDQAGAGPFHRFDHPTAPVPVDGEGAIAAAIYVAQVMQRFVRADWFRAIDFVQPEGDGLGVKVDVGSDDVGRAVARDVASAVAKILADSRTFCSVRDVDVRNGPDDRSNLVRAQEQPSNQGRRNTCWAEGYLVQ